MNKFQQEQKEFIDKYGKITSTNVTLFYKLKMNTTKGYVINLGFWKSIVFSCYISIQKFIGIRQTKIVMSSDIKKELQREKIY